MLRHARSTASGSTHSIPSFNTTGAGDYHTIRTRVVVGAPDKSKCYKNCIGSGEARKGEGFPSPISQGSPRSSLETNHKLSSVKSSPRPKAEDLCQIMCNDAVLPLDMTLADSRQFTCRQSTELIMYYRRKVVLPPPPGRKDYVARALWSIEFENLIYLGFRRFCYIILI